MPPTREGGSDPRRGVEAWLRSPVRLAACGLLFAALAALMSSIGNIELRLVRGFGPSSGQILGSQALNWVLLVFLATPLGFGAVRLVRSVRPLPLAVAAIVLASSAVAAMLFVQQTVTGRWFSEVGRPSRAAPDPAVEAVEAAAAGDEGARSELPRDEGAPSEPPSDAAVPSERSEPSRAEGRRASGPGERSGRDGPGQGGGRRGGRGEPGSDDRDGFARRPGPRGARGFGRPSLAESLRWGWSLRFPRVLLATWACAGIGVALRLFLEGRDREREARALELRASSLEAELAVAQLDSLRAQIHPHFLFNSLHSIGGLVRSGDAGAALSTLDALGGLLRTGLESHGDALVPLADELDLLERYLAVERVRLGDRLVVEIDVPAELLADEVPPFLLQPLVENAIRHAVAERAEGGRVRVSARAHGDEWTLDVDDDGPGFEPQVAAGEGWGIGLANVRGRLRTLFESAARFELGRGPLGGARVRLVLPRDEAPARSDAGPDDGGTDEDARR